MKKRNKTLTPKMLRKRIDKGMANTDKLNFLENYAMFMGKAQLIEFSLKKILMRRYRYSESKCKDMTLGRAITKLEIFGLRKDFVSLLRNLKEIRNDMAHEFLMNHLVAVSLDSRFGRFSRKPLRNALYVVEAAWYYVRFTLESGHWQCKMKCPFWAKNGLMQRNKQHRLPSELYASTD